MREKQKPRGGDETYMSSREWLEKHGLKSRKLGFYDILGSVAFKHQDGVVDLLHAPVMEYQTDAVSIVNKTILKIMNVYWPIRMIYYR